MPMTLQGSFMRKNLYRFFLKFSGLSLVVTLLSSCQSVAVLDPKGPIGAQEKSLILITLVLMLIVAIPVFAMVIWFTIRYREKNKKATYKPEWEGSLKIESAIWLIPLAIIVVLSYLTWTSTIELDPYRPIASKVQPLRVEVVSLDWKWLFIYPDYDIATVNKLVIPAGTPVTFDLTSATVMTSFFIPRLGSQIYAMAGMVSHLNLMADSPGTFTGKNMEYSGVGYSAMHFKTISLTPEQFKAWLQAAKSEPKALTLAEFDQLNTPMVNYPETTYASVDPGLFNHIVDSFMPTQKDVQQEKPMIMPKSDQQNSSSTMPMSDQMKMPTTK
jgi:cytochrome o ubiquinol oxidase subunit 2